MFNSDIRDELTELCEVKVNYKSKSYLKLSTLITTIVFYAAKLEN